MKMQINIFTTMKMNKPHSLIILISITAEGPDYCLEQSDTEMKILFLNKKSHTEGNKI